MIADTLLKRPGAWLSHARDRAVRIVLSSRVRLARNIVGAAFPGWAGKEERVRLCERLVEVVRDVLGASSTFYFDMGATSPMDRELLRERRLISAELAEKGAGSGVVVSDDERVAVMINEEDHLRIQVISAGVAIDEVWRRADGLDSAIEQRVRYAFSPELGYLTACPSNLGTGLRASVMMHLSGLRLQNETGQVIKGLECLGLVARGLHGEGTEAHGNLFQISNQWTLGESEEAIVERFGKVVAAVEVHERNARGRLQGAAAPIVLDHVARALGILTHARLLPSNEAVDLLSALRLGVDLGLVRKLSVAELNEIMLVTQPAHMQKLVGRTMEPETRDAARAESIRGRLKSVTLAV